MGSFFPPTGLDSFSPQQATWLCPIHFAKQCREDKDKMRPCPCKASEAISKKFDEFVREQGKRDRSILMWKLFPDEFPEPQLALPATPSPVSFAPPLPSTQPQPPPPQPKYAPTTRGSAPPAPSAQDGASSSAGSAGFVAAVTPPGPPPKFVQPSIALPAPSTWQAWASSSAGSADPAAAAATPVPAGCIDEILNRIRELELKQQECQALISGIKESLTEIVGEWV